MPRVLVIGICLAALVVGSDAVQAQGARMNASGLLNAPAFAPMPTPRSTAGRWIAMRSNARPLSTPRSIPDPCAE